MLVRSAHCDPTEPDQQLAFAANVLSPNTANFVTLGNPVATSGDGLLRAVLPN